MFKFIFFMNFDSLFTSYHIVITLDLVRPDYFEPSMFIKSIYPSIYILRAWDLLRKREIEKLSKKA